MWREQLLAVYMFMYMYDISLYAEYKRIYFYLCISRHSQYSDMLSNFATQKKCFYYNLDLALISVRWPFDKNNSRLISSCFNIFIVILIYFIQKYLRMLNIVSSLLLIQVLASFFVSLQIQWSQPLNWSKTAMCTRWQWPRRQELSAFHSSWMRNSMKSRWMAAKSRALWRGRVTSSSIRK